MVRRFAIDYGCSRMPRLAAGFVLLLSLAVVFGQVNTANMTPEQIKALVNAQPRIDVESPVAPTAVFDPPVVRPGGQATYRVTLDALEPSIEWPATIDVPGLELQPRGRGQVLMGLGDRYQPRTSYTYRVRPQRPGQFVVPEFTVTVYGKPVKIPEARLEVRTDLPAEIPGPELLLLKLSARTNVYVGEPVRARVLLPGRADGRIQLLDQVRLNGDGLVVDQSTAQQRVERFAEVPGITVPVFIHEVWLTPIAAGKITMTAQGFVAGNRFSGGVVITGPAIIPGGPPPYTLLDSEPVEMWVRPLPREGQLPGFMGAVGSYMSDTPVLATNDLRVGEAVKLTVRVYGEAGLGRLLAPPAPRLRDWQVFAEPSENVAPQVLHARGFATLAYTLIPLSDHVRATPAIPFSCFDPRRGAYLDLTIASVPVKVRPGAVPIAAARSGQARGQGEAEEPEPSLSGLAAAPGLGAGSLVPLQLQGWFPLLQLAPAAVLLVVWGWDRRRRYFEQHPAELLCRRARRAVRRVKRRLDAAARQQNEAEYRHNAIALMRVACAPHYPAEPRALVGGDVLALFDEPDRLGRPGDVVRAFFKASDAAEFAVGANAPVEVLTLRGDFGRVVDILEARLQPAAAGNGKLPAIRRLAPWLFAAAIVVFGAGTNACAGRQGPVGPQARALFDTGTNAYRAADYLVAARAFEQAGELRPASGTFQNLGSAEWQRGRTGLAVLAWERALWLDPFNQAARANLRYARQTAQLESPELTWYEVVSTWLPVNWWAWITGFSFWGAVAAGMLPGILRWRKAAWQQAVAAVGLALFLLSVPAHFGVLSRSRIGFILQKNTPLRLTPTEEAQPVTYLTAGDPARLERTRGKYLLIRASRATGWVQVDDFVRICAPAR